MLHVDLFHQIHLASPYPLHSTWIELALHTLMGLNWTCIGEVRIDLVFMVKSERGFN